MVMLISKESWGYEVSGRLSEIAQWVKENEAKVGPRAETILSIIIPEKKEVEIKIVEKR